MNFAIIFNLDNLQRDKVGLVAITRNLPVGLNLGQFLDEFSRSFTATHTV